MRSDYDCPTCLGSGDTECGCCGSEQTCGACKGTGFDASLFDWYRFDLDHGSLCRRWNGSCLLVRDGKAVGRQSINRAQAKGPEYADEVIYFDTYAHEATNGR